MGAAVNPQPGIDEYGVERVPVEVVPVSVLGTGDVVWMCAKWRRVLHVLAPYGTESLQVGYEGGEPIWVVWVAHPPGSVVLRRCVPQSSSPRSSENT